MAGEQSRINGRKGGKPKGYKHPQTLERLVDREAMREQARQIFLKHFAPIIEAQAEHSKGIGYMVLRRPDGTYVRATEAAQVDAALAAGSTTFKLYTQAPNPQAFAALWDRTLDKPIERVEATGKDGGPLEIIVRKPWESKAK